MLTTCNTKSSEHLMTKQPQNITQFIQSHPYQYLNQLNSTFDYYHKTNVNNRCYSSASRVKLPWKQFKTVRIPECFKQTFMQQKRQSNFHNTNHLDQHNQTQKKFWRDHTDILKRYSSNKTKQKPSLSLANSRHLKQKKKQLVDRLVSQNRHNLFLKKIIEKGADLSYNEAQLMEQVLCKLSIIKEKGTLRAKTAGFNRTRPQSKNSLKRQQNIVLEAKSNQKEETVKLQQQIQTSQNQILQFEKKKDMISNYQRRIRQIDCSISQNNIKKAVGLIKEMHEILQK